MKYHLIKPVILTVAFVICSSSNGFALYFSEIDDNDTVRIFKDDETLGSSSGGEFKIDVLGEGNEGNDSYDFISFCVEMGEHVYTNYDQTYWGYTYSIDSISDTAQGGGTVRGTDDLVPADEGGDPISEETKWWFWTYLNGGLGGKTGDIADAVQNIIWWLEGELWDLDSEYLSFYGTNRNIALQEDGSYYFGINGKVKVLNISYGDTLAQSQLIAEPVPEPATMLLLGTGLAGLAGCAARRRKASRS